MPLPRTNLYDKSAKDREEDAADAGNEIGSHDQPVIRRGIFPGNQVTTPDTDNPFFQAALSEPQKDDACHDDKDPQG